MALISGSLIGGAVLGAFAGELLKVVVEASKKYAEFQTAFDRLQTTLDTIDLHLNKINCLDHDLDIKQKSMKDLQILVSNGESLIRSCSDISRLNIINKSRYHDKLICLNEDLQNSFRTLLPLHNLFSGQNSSANLREGQEGSSSSAYVENNGFFLLKEHVGTYYDLDLEELEDINKLVKEGTPNYNKYETKDNNNNVFFVKSVNLHVSKFGKWEFQQRMENIAKIEQHPNVKLPFGYFSSEDSRFLLYDYMPGCTLHHLLTETKCSSGSREIWNRNIKIVVGAATGISHIHTAGMIHGNINSTNIIQTENLDGCISNFGLSMIMNNPEEEEVGAPELKKTREATQKTDVYDFGVVLMSLINLWDAHLLFHPNMFKEEKAIKHIGQSCTNKDPTKRPNMDAVVTALSLHLSLS